MNKFTTDDIIDDEANCSYPLLFTPIGLYRQWCPLKCFGSSTTMQ